VFVAGALDVSATVVDPRCRPVDVDVSDKGCAQVHDAGDDNDDGAVNEQVNVQSSSSLSSRRLCPRRGFAFP